MLELAIIHNIGDGRSYAKHHSCCREYSAVTGEWFFNQTRKHQTENDYTPNLPENNTNNESQYISGVLLCQLKKLEKRRQGKQILYYI